MERGTLKSTESAPRSPSVEQELYQPPCFDRQQERTRSRQGDSNPRHPLYKSGALPLSYVGQDNEKYRRAVQMACHVLRARQRSG